MVETLNGSFAVASSSKVSLYASVQEMHLSSQEAANTGQP
jgi:hypothetical protein